MVTLDDIAAYSGLSRATISRVVNGNNKVAKKTQQKVNNAIKELGYIPNTAARTLASNKSNIIGFVTTSYQGAFFGALLGSIQTFLEEQNKQLIVTRGRNSSENEEEAIKRLKMLACDGVMLHVRSISDNDLASLLSQNPKIIIIDRLIKNFEEQCVSFNHMAAGRLVADTFIEYNHKRIACISGPSNRSSPHLRIDGFLARLKENNIQVIQHESAEDYTLQDGYQKTNDILNKHIPTALYCCSEELALGAILSINEHNLKIPDDISMICYDSGQRAEFFQPKLTTLHFPITEMANYACQNLLSRNSKHKEFKPQIFMRNSLKKL